MEFLQNLSRKQAVAVVSVTAVVILLVIAFVWNLNVKEKKQTEERDTEQIILEKKEELQGLRDQSGNFEPTEDPVEQKDQLEVLRRKNQLEDELGEGEEFQGETNDKGIQKQELQNLREQSQ